MPPHANKKKLVFESPGSVGEWEFLVGEWELLVRTRNCEWACLVGEWELLVRTRNCEWQIIVGEWEFLVSEWAILVFANATRKTRVFSSAD